MKIGVVEMILVILVVAVIVDVFKGWLFPTLKYLLGFVVANGYAILVSRRIDDG